MRRLDWTELVGVRASLGEDMAFAGAGRRVRLALLVDGVLISWNGGDPYPPRLIWKSFGPGNTAYVVCGRLNSSLLGLRLVFVIVQTRSLVAVW